MTISQSEALDQSEIPPGTKPFYKGILYGEFGTWKTVTACGLAKNSGKLLACDSGWTSLLNHPEILEKIKVYEYQGLSQITAIANNLGDSDIVVVDTVSQIQDNYIDFLMDNVTWAGNFREVATPNPKTKINELITTPAMQDYHVTRNKMRPHLRRLLLAPINVVFLTHVREPSQMEIQKGKILRRPSVTQKVYELIAREADFIGFMEKKSKDPVASISFRTDPKTVAKSRIGTLRDEDIPATDLKKILTDWTA